MEKFFVRLAREPPVHLSCSFVRDPAQSPRDSLIVCISGIDNPQTIWYPTIAALQKSETKYLPPVLLYDRVGQGKSIGINADVPGRPKHHGRDCLNAAHDIRELVVSVGETCLGFRPENINGLQIILVASSVGCAIARLYAESYPRTVVALLFLDSTIANSDTISVFPDPEAPDFCAEHLPSGVTPELCTSTRRIIHKLYHPTAANQEGLWRGNLPELLPHADQPKLLGPKPGTPYVTVVEHDQSTFASFGAKLLGLSETMSNLYFNPKWQQYNIGLTKITEPHLSKGPIEAKGCNHLIQKDGPQFVADEIAELLEKLRGEASRL